MADQGQHSRREAGTLAIKLTQAHTLNADSNCMGVLVLVARAPTCQRGCRAFKSRCCGQDTKAARETGALQEFYAMLAADPARAFYGPGHVRAAAELGAVGTLLLSDSLLRVNDVQQARLLTLALWAARCQRRA